MYILQNKINDQYLESISGNGIPSFTDNKTRSLIFFDFDEDFYKALAVIRNYTGQYPFMIEL